MGSAAACSSISCRSCKQPLAKRGRGDARASKKALGLYLVAAVVGGAWIVFVVLWSPVFLVPTGVGGLAACAVFYLAPGVLIATLASRVPKVRTLTCARCGWTEVTTLRH